MATAIGTFVAESAYEKATPKKTFFLLQATRAVAALLVVFYHGSLALHALGPPVFPIFSQAGIGVDIFFVISGFVMALSAAPLLHQPHAMRTFLTRRLERIVPLYWIVTTLQVIVSVVAPNLMKQTIGGAWRVVSSYLFLPTFAFPIVNQGWTLNYEMFFYLLFAVALELNVQPLQLLSPIFVSLCLAYHFVPADMPTLARICNPIMIEFLFGMVLATFVLKPKLLQSTSVRILLACSVTLYLVALRLNFLGRPARWGVPALGFIVLAVVAERRVGVMMPRWVRALGDASYSIYLIHVLVLAFSFPVFKGLMVPTRPAEYLFLVVYMILTSLLGVLCYQCVEKPIIEHFRERRERSMSS